MKRLTKRKFFALAFIVMIVMLFIGACAQSQKVTVMPTAIATQVLDYRQLLDQAEYAYKSGDFTRASTLAKDAALIAPENDATWEMVELAAVAQAGNAYLQKLPSRPIARGRSLAILGLAIRLTHNQECLC